MGSLSLFGNWSSWPKVATCSSTPETLLYRTGSFTKPYRGMGRYQSLEDQSEYNQHQLNLQSLGHHFHHGSLRFPSSYCSAFRALVSSHGGRFGAPGTAVAFGRTHPAAAAEDGGIEWWDGTTHLPQGGKVTVGSAWKDERNIWPVAVVDPFSWEYVI